MLLLLSPAKTLDYERVAPVAAEGRPHFADRAAELIDLLRERTPAQIAELMSLSESLAQLNAARYAAWRPRFTSSNSKPALFAFNGDVYEGLDAGSLGEDDIAWAHEHLGILSGLYGVLRPLDSLQPYRLEMGTRLANAKGKDLYAFWGDAIARHLNRRLSREAAPIVVNLASEEYFRSVDQRVLKARVLQCVFEEWKPAGWKIVSFHAKRARGLMARHAILTRARTPEVLQQFRLEGYAFDRGASEPDRLVFRRRSV